MDTHEAPKDGKHPDPRKLNHRLADIIDGGELFDVALLRERVEEGNGQRLSPAGPIGGRDMNGLVKELRLPPSEKPPMRGPGPRVSAQMQANSNQG